MCAVSFKVPASRKILQVLASHVLQITRFNDFGDSKNDDVVLKFKCGRDAVSICCPLLVVGRLIKLTPQSNQIKYKIARIWKVDATGRTTTNKASPNQSRTSSFLLSQSLSLVHSVCCQGLEHMFLLLLLSSLTPAIKCSLIRVCVKGIRKRGQGQQQ